MYVRAVKLVHCVKGIDSQAEPIFCLCGLRLPGSLFDISRYELKIKRVFSYPGGRQRSMSGFVRLKLMLYYLGGS